MLIYNRKACINKKQLLNLNLHVVYKKNTTTVITLLRVICDFSAIPTNPIKLMIT